MLKLCICLRVKFSLTVSTPGSSYWLVCHDSVGVHLDKCKYCNAHSSQW